jgi:hypothetical protein
LPASPHPQLMGDIFPSLKVSQLSLCSSTSTGFKPDVLPGERLWQGVAQLLVVPPHCAVFCGLLLGPSKFSLVGSYSSHALILDTTGSVNSSVCVDVMLAPVEVTWGVGAGVGRGRNQTTEGKFTDRSRKGFCSRPTAQCDCVSTH